MKTLFSLLILLCAMSSSAEEFSIFEYEFKWEIFNSDGVNAYVSKDESNTLIKIVDTSQYSNISISPSQAEQLSKELSKAKSYFEKQRFTEVDVHEDVEVGDIHVQYSTSVVYGFRVFVKKDRRSIMGTISFSLKQAIGLAKEISESIEKAEFVDSKIKL